jgi:5-methylcytosine-specific restriction endonuclease McrA
MIELLNVDCMEYMKGLPDKVAITKKKKSERMKLYYQNNKEAQKLKSKLYRENNRESFNKYRNNYRTKTAGGIYDVIKQGAKKRGVEFLIQRQSFIHWFNSQQKQCYYCKRTENEVMADEVIIRKKMTRLTIDRMINSKGYEDDNLALACMRCNSIKSNFFTPDEMMIIGKIINIKSQCQK